MNNNTLEIFKSVLVNRLHKFNKEQLEGAVYFLFTLYERLPSKWKIVDTSPLNELALAELFDIISEMCTYLKTITQRYKSTDWLNGSLVIIDIFRIHLKTMKRDTYTLVDVANLIKYFISYIDEQLDSHTE